MAEAKTIKLLLTNGSLSGLLMAELLKWEGILFSSPRESYHLLSNEPESNYWGVYLLVSEEKVYIGQANDLLRRIGEHDKTKDWWEKVILLTTKDNSLNRSDIDFLENKLISIAKSRGSLEMNNVQIGNTPKVSRYRETELVDFLEGGLLLLELIGIKVLAKPLKSTDTFKSKLGFQRQTNYNKEKVISNKVTEIQSINKSRAIEQLKANHYLEFKDGNVSFASLQINKKIYWANPNVELLNSKWYIILNNQISRVLIVLEIPPKTFNIIQGSSDKCLITRSDKPYYIDLNIRQDDYIDVRSKCDFSSYIKKVVGY